MFYNYTVVSSYLLVSITASSDEDFSYSSQPARVCYDWAGPVTSREKSKRVVAPPFVSILLPLLGLCCRLFFTCLKHMREGKCGHRGGAGAQCYRDFPYAGFLPFASAVHGDLAELQILRARYVSARYVLVSTKLTKITLFHVH